MSNCTPCTPANDELPIFCDPFPATDTAKRLLVEDEAFCQKALNIPTTPNQILKTNSSGNIQWGTLNSVLQSGPVDLGSQPLNTTGAITAKTVSVTNTGTGNGISIQTVDGIPLSIQSTNTNPVKGGTLQFFTASGDMEFNGASDGVFTFYNNSTASTKAIAFSGANVGIGTLAPTDSLYVNGTATIVGRLTINGLPKLTGLSVYANNAAALAGGLVVNDVYKTATGELRIVV